MNLVVAITTAEWLTIFGIILGPAGLGAVYISLRKLKPETQSLVMSSTDTGVKVLSGVVETVSMQWERAENARIRCEEQVERRDQYIKKIREECDSQLEDKTREIRRLNALLDQRK